MSNNHDDILVIRGMLDNLRACSDSQLSFLINQSQILRGVSPLIPSLQVPTASVEIADPKCSVSKGGPEGKTKEVKGLIGKPGSAYVSVRGVNVDCSEHDGGLECANLSNPLPPIAIWINQVSRYKFLCPLLSHDHEISAYPDFLALSPKDRWCKTPRGCICFTCLTLSGRGYIFPTSDF